MFWSLRLEMCFVRSPWKKIPSDFFYRQIKSWSPCSPSAPGHPKFQFTLNIAGIIVLWLYLFHNHVFQYTWVKNQEKHLWKCGACEVNVCLYFWLYSLFDLEEHVQHSRTFFFLTKVNAFWKLNIWPEKVKAKFKVSNFCQG